MQLNLRILGREMNDGMLEALRDFLVNHQYEGEYQISIEKMDQRPATQPAAEAALRMPAATIPSGTSRGRITVRRKEQQEQADPVSFTFDQDRKEVFSPNGKFTFKKRR